jgi:hypothetical protein
LLTTTPAGRGSVKAKFVKSVSLGAKMSILRREFPPTGMVEGENDFTPVTSVLATVTFELAAVEFPTPCAVVRAPAGIVFVNCPEVVPAGTVT